MLKKEKSKTNLRQPVSGTWAYIVAFMIPALLLTLLFAAEHVAPFGDRTLLTEDMRRQYVAFYAYYQQVASEGQNWFYSLRLGLGGGTFGMLTYYLMSPLLLILPLIPKRYFPEFVTCMVIIKCGMCGLTSYLYLSHMIRRVRRRTWLLSTSFALCTFLMANCFNTMWTDAVIVLPVLLFCCENMMQKRTFRWTAGYTLCVTLILAENYYIGYMCLLFTALWVLSLLIFGVQKKETAQSGSGPEKRNDWFADRIRCGVHVLLATITGLLLSMFLMWPTFCSISGSAKDTQIMEDPSAAMNLAPRHVLAKLLSLSYDYTEIFTGLPNIYIGLPALLLAVLYFVAAKRGLVQKLRLGLLLVILMMSMCISPLNRIWHAGMLPSGYLYRNSLFFSLLLVMAACYAADGWEESSLKEKLAAAGITGALLLYAGSAPVSVLDGSKRSWNALVFAAMAAAVLLTGLSDHKQSAWRSFWLSAPLLFLSGLQIMDLALNQNCVYRVISIVAESREAYRSAVDQADPVWAGIRNMDSSVYRAESLTPHSENNSLQYGYNGVTHYSSVQQMEDRIFLQKLGFNDTGLLAGYGTGQTAAADALLGIRYLVAGDEVIENKATLPLIYTGVIPENDDLDQVSETALQEGPFVFTEEALRLLTGEDGSVFHEADFTASETDFTPAKTPSDISGQADDQPAKNVQDLQETYRVKGTADGPMYLFIMGTEDKPQDIQILVNGTEIGHFGNDSCRKVLRLGVFSKDEPFRLTLAGNGKAPEYDRLLLVTEDTRALADMVMPAEKHAVQPELVSSSHMKISIDPSLLADAGQDEENALILLIPWSRNWHISVDGHKAEPQILLDEYMAVPLTVRGRIQEGGMPVSSGQQEVPAGASDQQKAMSAALDMAGSQERIEIDMHYVPEGWYAGIAMTVLGLVVSGIYVWWCRRHQSM